MGRLVEMDAEQYDEIERCIAALMRAGYTERARRMMTLSLRYRFAKDREPVLPENVVELHGHSRKVIA